MHNIPLVAAINDLSGFGRCSLTVSIPVLSAMGFQVCPLPTAILSNHTGYESCYFDDYTPHMSAYIEEWEKRGLKFSAIYTGFLGNAAQIELILSFIKRFCDAQTLLLVDPVMADNGLPYSTCDAPICQGMARLAARAWVITPNLTEACILAGESYSKLILCDDSERRARICAVAETLARRGCRYVVITGIPLDGGLIGNFGYDSSGKASFWENVKAFDECYAGTGDLFASVLCGALTNGVKLQPAVRFAADFVSRVFAFCRESNLPAMDGMAFEPFLGALASDFSQLKRE